MGIHPNKQTLQELRDGHNVMGFMNRVLWEDIYITIWGYMRHYRN